MIDALDLLILTMVVFFGFALWYGIVKAAYYFHDKCDKDKENKLYYD